jgi:multiple antibiotic resistance protein
MLRTPFVESVSCCSRRVSLHKNEFLAQSIMSDLLEPALKFFIVFFVVVEPISLIPVFSGLTEGASDSYKHKMALKSVLVASLILLIFALVGAGFLSAMGISINSFRIFGGLLLFLIALEMVFARESGTRTSSDEKVESKKRADISVFPLAFPFMAGPGALTTMLLWFGPIPVTEAPVQFTLMFACALLVLFCCLVAMRVAGPLMRIIGVTGTNVANRLFGVVLGALAVQFIVDGIRQSFAL